MKRYFLTAIVFILVASQSTLIVAQELNIQERMKHRRAVEAVVWSMPLINFMAMRDGLKRDAGVELNNVAYNSRVQNWKLQITTPNNTTPYIMIFWNLEDGPMVIDIPASGEGVALFGTLMDAWQRPLADVGGQGRDRGRGSRYLLLPPGYQGDYPKGFIPLRQKTYNGYALMRPVIANTSEENLVKAQSFVKKIKVYPLSGVKNPPKTHFVDIYDKEIDAVAHFDLSYFKMLHQILQEEDIDEKDMVMMAMLKALGIEKGKPFNPTGREIEILNAAGKEAHNYLVDTYFNNGLTPKLYGDERQWSILVPTTAVDTVFTWEMPGYLDIDGRGATYFALFSSVEEFDLFNPPTMYLLSNKDAKGKQLNGSHNYRLKVPRDVPMEQFWSVIAYTTEDATWFNGLSKYGVASIDQGLSVEKDGSVNVYFGPEAPDGKEDNWVPTRSGEDYFLYFRLYRPTAPLFTREWRLNDVQKGW